MGGLKNNTNDMRWVVLVGIAWFGVVFAGLFVPLMDNDSAHHANIALRMFLTGDYVSLIDYDGPYLDKPHLHFWLSAASYHMFGVNGFAYKFPSFLISLLGIWAVYRSGCILINRQAGIWSAMIYATSAAILLSLNDVRMDAILTACVAISIWQIGGYFSAGNIKYVVGAALGMAMGFCTKGHIGIFIPILFALTYAYYSKKWRRVLSWKAIVAILLFFLFISPVVYCYYLQFNLHPELVVRGINNIDGVRFILWDQSLGRFSGEMGGDAKGDKLFFLHTFLWVFAPWSLVGLISFVYYSKIKRLSALTRAVLVVTAVFALIVGFSSFKLPHYLNVILPLTSLWIAGLTTHDKNIFLWVSKWVERGMWSLIGLFAGMLLIWWFPDQSILFWVGLVIYLAILFYLIKIRTGNQTSLQIMRLSAATLVIFWMLNSGFYPHLLKYQAGNVLAEREEVQHIKDPIYSLGGFYSSSFYFYRKELRKEVGLEKMREEVNSIIMDKRQMSEFLQLNDGWRIKKSNLDYEITKLDLKFLDREKRNDHCNEVIIMTRN